MKPLLLSLFTDSSHVRHLQELLDCDYCTVNHHTFPDGETYLQIPEEGVGGLKGRDVIILDSLCLPNPKTVPLIFLAETVRELGAKKVGLVCPYLAYMRQDKRFHHGEGITSTYFAKILSNAFDWLVTIDPHLHRRISLDEIYTIPSQVIHANSQIAAWVKENVKHPLFIGPDAESEQWVSSIANLAGAPFVILEKTRSGDQDVQVHVPDLDVYKNNTPVLVDDIISTAQTMIQTIIHLHKKAMKKPVCIGVHAIFAGEAYVNLIKADVLRVVTCNTISHPTNDIDIYPLLIKGIRNFKTA